MKRPVTFTLLLDYVVFLLVRLLEEFLNILPERAAFTLGRVVGRFGYVLLPDRRHAAIENLTIAFGREKSPQWIMCTARKSFEHVGMLAMEFFLIRRWTHKKIAERIVIEGKLPFNLTMMPGNHGICLVNSHFGCFEVSAATVKFLGINLNLIQTGLRNPFLSRYFFSRAGEGTGIKTYGHKGVFREMLGLLHSGEMVAFLADQRGDPERGILVNYFGTLAPANEIFARLAIEGKAYVMPLSTFRRGDGRYQSVFGEEILIEPSGDMKKDLITVSQQFHDVFESWLRAWPEQGFWLQRKWRRTPSRRRSRQTYGKAVPNEPGAGTFSEN